MVFYRYIRPIRFNETRMSLDTEPRGGICLRFEENQDGTLRFVHARCHADELFSKDVAKKIADWRSKHPPYVPNIPYAKETGVLIEHAIDWCESWIPSRDDHAAVYKMNEVRCLGAALLEIASRNQAEQHKAEVWKAGVEAINTIERYREYEKHDSGKVAGGYD